MGDNPYMKYCKMPVLFSGGHKLCHMSSAQCTKTNKQKAQQQITPEGFFLLTNMFGPSQKRF